MNQDNKTLIILGSLVVIGTVTFCCYQKSLRGESVIVPQNDYKNISYQIEGEKVILKNLRSKLILISKQT